MGFRPLTGTLLSKLWDVNVSLILETVSVPSRGLSYLNYYTLASMVENYVEFPSPHGDSLI